MSAYGIRVQSHYQGSSPGPVLAAFDTQAEAERMADWLSTCSFCSPGRAAGYSTGTCYRVVTTSRASGYIHPEAPDKVVEAVTGLAS